LLDDARCRICFGQEGELITPCKCSGTCAFVHRDCLDAWRAAQESARGVCGTCGFRYELSDSNRAARRAFDVGIVGILALLAWQLCLFKPFRLGIVITFIEQLGRILSVGVVFYAGTLALVEAKAMLTRPAVLRDQDRDMGCLIALGCPIIPSLYSAFKVLVQDGVSSWSVWLAFRAQLEHTTEAVAFATCLYLFPYTVRTTRRAILDKVFGNSGMLAPVVSLQA